MRRIQKKICLLGDFAVGKTSLIRRHVEGRFDERYLTTVGVVVSRKTLAFPDLEFNMLIWDLAGGRDFSQSDYLLGIAGAILVCDITRYQTLAAINTYAIQVRQANPEAKTLLLANKIDLSDERDIEDEQLFAIGQELSAPVQFTSAKTGYQVDVAFESLANALVSEYR
jgi:small GTP-binding protein